MKIAIISIYDSSYNFNVYLNGVVIDLDTIQGFYDPKTRVIKRKYKDTARKIYNAYNDNSYWEFTSILEEYDTIFLCEDGNVEKLK